MTVPCDVGILESTKEIYKGLALETVFTVEKIKPRILRRQGGRAPLTAYDTQPIGVAGHGLSNNQGDTIHRGQDKL